MRFLLFTAIVFGIFYFFYNKLRRFLAQLFQPLTSEDSGDANNRENSGQKRINKGEMKQCPVCGVYFPEGTGVKLRGTEYCSASCAEKGKS